MKHLISLSLKYIRRQKLRSVLTFMCITLSVFIFNTFSAYLSSLIKTVENYEISNYGSWEASFHGPVNDCEDKIAAAKIVKNHAAVSDSYIKVLNTASTSRSRNEEGRLSFFELNLSDGRTLRVSQLFYHGYDGNQTLLGNASYGDPFSNQTDIDIADGEIYAPSWLADYGFEIGDTISFTVNAASGVLDEDMPQVKATLERLQQLEKEKNGLYLIADSMYGYEGELPVIGNLPLLHYMTEDYSFSDIELSDMIRGEKTQEYTLKIIGFRQQGDESSFSFSSGLDCPIDIDSLYKDNEDILLEEAHYDEWVQPYVRISENIDFNEGLTMVYTALGYDEGTLYKYFNDYDSVESCNWDLLSIEFRSFQAIAKLLPFIVILLFLAFIVWAISRFVIDNAFEISVQERSSQFAALRIMGASKTQILALVLTEGVFYSLTALPIGAIAAFGLCSSVMSSFRNTGFSYFEFDANPVITLVGIMLCALSIFISSYTSAMWAAGKLSPKEALNYGKPSKIKKRKIKKEQKSKNKTAAKKSKLKKGSKGFIFRYTMKNILRTKKRFLISTIAMAFGVLMFTFCMLSGMYISSEIKKYNLFDRDGHDFYTSSDGMYADMAIDTFSDTELFSEYNIYCYANRNLNHTMQEALADFMPESHLTTSHIQISSVDRDVYEEAIEPLTGFSYDEFVSSETALALVCPYDLSTLYSFDENYVRIYEDYYKSYSELGLEKMPEITFLEGESLEISGAVCTMPEEGNYSFPCLIIPFDNAEKLLSNGNFPYIVNIYATVKSPENYIEAEKAAMSFADLTGNILTNNYMLYTGLQEFIKAIIKAALALIASIWLVGIFSMVNSINTSVLNRQTELLMLRSVGMSRRQLFTTVIIESILFSSFSAIIGTALGIGSFAFMVEVVLGDREFILTGSIIAASLISIAVNTLIAAAAALPGLQSLSKRMKANSTD